MACTIEDTYKTPRIYEMVDVDSYPKPSSKVECLLERMANALERQTPAAPTPVEDEVTLARWHEADMVRKENNRLQNEVEALRAQLLLTPEKVEAAINAYLEPHPGIRHESLAEALPRAMRAALLAAGMTDAALDAAEEER